MVDRQAARGQRVTPLELSFDLVVVFAITQVTSFLWSHPTWDGRGGLAQGRSVATVVLFGLLPVARDVPALTALGLVAAVCVSLIA